MPKNSSRKQRIGEQILRDLAELIRLELKDPRVGMITLTDVEVSPDYSHAKVFFTALGDAAQLEQTAAALQHAAGFLRSQLGRLIKLRVTPELHFVYDQSVARGAQLSQLIDQALAADRKSAADD